MKCLLKKSIIDRSQIINCEDMNFNPLDNGDNEGGYFSNSDLVNKFCDEFRPHRTARYELKMDFIGQ